MFSIVGPSFLPPARVSNAEARAAVVTMSEYSDRKVGVTKDQVVLARAVVDRFIRECRVAAGEP
jgi:hypothetical protein